MRSREVRTSEPTRVVVCGAGFGGLWAARKFAGEPGVEVLLLDRNNYHTFYPLLYQVAAAELGPTDIAYPVRSILRSAPNVHFRMAEVCALDLERRVLTTSLGQEVGYEQLILSLGSVPNFFGVEGAAEHAFTLREMDHAIPLRHHILSRFETAVYEAHPERRRRLLTFVIVGGGPTGVEYAGALAELIHGPLLRDYPMIHADEVEVILVEALDGLLTGMDEELGTYARDRLESRRVEVRTGAMATRVGPDRIELKGGECIATETVVWTAGVKGDARVQSWGLPMARADRVEVTPGLHLPDHPEVFVVGDLCWFEQDGEPLPQVAPVAMQQGEYAAETVLARRNGGRVAPFRYDDPGMLAVIGRNAAVAELWGRTFTGFVAWILWLVIHVAKLVGFRNRILVMVNWAWNYINYEQAVRLILPFRPGRGVDTEVEKLDETPSP